MTATGASQAFHVNAYAEKHVHEVRLERIRIAARTSGEIAHASNWQMKDVILATPQGSNVTLVDTSNVMLPRAIKLAAGPVAPGESAAPEKQAKEDRPDASADAGTKLNAAYSN